MNSGESLFGSEIGSEETAKIVRIPCDVVCQFCVDVAQIAHSEPEITNKIDYLWAWPFLFASIAFCFF